MSGDIKESLEHLREGLDIHATDADAQKLYEQWLSEDQWPLTTVALPLVVGCDPEAWSAHVESHALEDAVEAVLSSLAAESGDAEMPISVTQLAGWARTHNLELPLAMSRLLEFIGSVLGQSQLPVTDQANAFAAAEEREILLGAALALVTKFPQQCRDANGFFDGALIAQLILEKGALWFPGAPPSLSRDEIAQLLEHYLT